VTTDDTLFLSSQQQTRYGTCNSNTSSSMSWQTYVDDQLKAAGFAHAAIIGHDGGPWAVTAGFGLKPGEGTKVVALFNKPEDIFVSGVTVNAVKYMGIKGDPRSLYGKKGAGGVVIVKTTQTVLIGVYDEKLQPGNAATVVEKLADYLIDTGY